MDKKYTTNSVQETQEIAMKFATHILQQKPGNHAVVLGLEGDLGAGKTTFLQGFAKGLGIEEKILSPTFVIMKKFEIPNSSFRFFYHFDCYRLNTSEPASAKGSGAAKEILELGFEEIISNPENIVAIEWPEKISEILPKNIISIKFEHLEPAFAKGFGGATESKREIIIDRL